MKRILVVLLTVFGLSAASAQSDLFAGGSLDIEFIDGISFIAFDGQVGDYGLFGSFGGRGTLGLGIDPDFYLKLAGDALFPFELDNPDLMPYAGGGFGIYVGDFSTFFSIHGLGGLEFAVDEQIGLFSEISPGLYIGSGDTEFGVGLRFGANFGL